jgi:hypothetical protein
LRKGRTSLAQLHQGLPELVVFELGFLQLGPGLLTRNDDDGVIPGLQPHHARRGAAGEQ